MNIIVAGDFCPRERVSDYIEKSNYAAVLGGVKDSVSNSDYALVNLECPVVEHESMPIDKCGPNLKCTSMAVEALKWAGFDCVTLANNHFLDFGEVGVKDTLAACQTQGLDHVGGGEYLNDANQILYREIKGQKLAVINCCEHEFSIATERTGGSNPLNIVKQYYDIQQARKRADHVIVIIHGGVELFWLPSKRMIETYRFFIDAGADAVVNHHQHCFSGYEVYKDKPIFYGLGNFCFDGNSNDYRWTSGYMVKLLIQDGKKTDFDIIPYRQCTEEASVTLLEGEEKEALLNQIDEYNRIIATDEIREEEYLKWCHQTEGMFKTVMNPILNRYTAWLFKTRLGKRIISKRKMLQTYNYLMNESHIERLKILVERELRNDN